MPLVDLVVFDIAGTTVQDSDFVGKAVQEALSEAGIELTIEDINPIMGMPKPIAIGILLKEAGSDLDVTPIHANFVEKMIQFYQNSPDVKPIEGAEEVFSNLREAGVKVTLDTGFSQDITNVILERLGWDENVQDGVVSSDQVAAGRPAPDMIHHHMENFGITDPSRVAKVGDAPADMNEGSNANCGFVIGVLSGAHSRESLELHPHTHIMDSIRDLPALLLEVANV